MEINNVNEFNTLLHNASHASFVLQEDLDLKDIIWHRIPPSTAFMLQSNAISPETKHLSIVPTFVPAIVPNNDRFLYFSLNKFTFKFFIFAIISLIYFILNKHKSTLKLKIINLSLMGIGFANIVLLLLGFYAFPVRMEINNVFQTMIDFYISH